jgi:hypothetical protein
MLVQFGYGLNYLIDNEHAIIVDVEPTPARTFDEVRATSVMIKRTQERFGVKPKRLAADTAYGTGKFLGWLAQEKIAPHIPVWDKSTREDGTFGRADFVFDPAQDQYTCPAGKTRFRVATMPMTASENTARASAIASHADSKRVVVRICRREMCCAASMRKLATLRVHLPGRQSSSGRVMSGRRSRCCLRI